VVLSQLQLQSLLVEEVFNVGIGVFGVSIILSWGREPTVRAHLCLSNPAPSRKSAGGEVGQDTPSPLPRSSALAPGPNEALQPTKGVSGLGLQLQTTSRSLGESVLKSVRVFKPPSKGVPALL